MNAKADKRRVVVVTGGSDGIGAAAARMLADRGDEVVVVGRSPDKTRAVAAATGAEGHVADFTRLDEVRELARELRARHTRVDVLLNNAGLIAGLGPTTRNWPPSCGTARRRCAAWQHPPRADGGLPGTETLTPFCREDS